MEHVIIIKADLNDLRGLKEIAHKTFEEAFSWGNSVANMNAYLTESFSTDKLRIEVSDVNSEFYLAILNEEIIGYLKVNFGLSQTEINDENALEIERIYVLKEFYGKNVGQRLYNKAIQIARERKKSYVWLGVWEKNVRAIQFYKKNGFVEFDKHIFMLGDDEQIDIMMKLSIK